MKHGSRQRRVKKAKPCRLIPAFCSDLCFICVHLWLCLLPVNLRLGSRIHLELGRFPVQLTEAAFRPPTDAPCLQPSTTPSSTSPASASSSSTARWAPACTDTSRPTRTGGTPPTAST